MLRLINDVPYPTVQKCQFGKYLSYVVSFTKTFKKPINLGRIFLFYPLALGSTKNNWETKMELQLYQEKKPPV